MRLANLWNMTRVLHRQVDQLKLQIKKLTEVNRVCLDKDIDADMCTIMNKHNDSIFASHSPQSESWKMPDKYDGIQWWSSGVWIYVCFLHHAMKHWDQASFGTYITWLYTYSESKTWNITRCGWTVNERSEVGRNIRPSEVCCPDTWWS